MMAYALLSMSGLASSTCSSRSQTGHLYHCAYTPCLDKCTLISSRPSVQSNTSILPRSMLQVYMLLHLNVSPLLERMGPDSSPLC
ncbi:hypothetical protein CC86DRAFT_109710 [Ophiobolus disseminans]|uniref:Uncharacterized protein n=1 Tax=Ophiobolus disseminans TaxID=1469910 RepID=A0A6A6ZKG0_9PLEO|nr:hypothetical protein CC86DRAFT_109710 [Ophiobolus disseminans]